MSEDLRWRNFFDVFEEGLQDAPEQEILGQVMDLEGRYQGYSWSDLVMLARRGQAAYRKLGLRRGDRALLALPTGEAFFAALLGAFREGICVAAVAPRENLRTAVTLREVESVRRIYGPDVIVADEGVDGCLHMAPQALLSAEPGNGDWAAPEEVQYVQFSSGSTGTPKGVVLSMNEICANLEMMRQRLSVWGEQRGLSWLPLYHDMGLFGGFLLCTYSMVHVTLMDPTLFVRNPLLWIRQMSERRATNTVTSPSALMATLRLLQLRPQENLDLSSLIRVIVGAEQVTPRLVELYHQVLGPHGAPPEALLPTYGLAEATLAATIPPLNSGLQVLDCIHRQHRLRQHQAVPSDPEDENAETWVACGSPLPGMELKIADQDGTPLPERSIGRVFLKGPSMLRGYLLDGQYHDCLGQWLDTEDLGYLADGHLFLTGRVRDLIIKGGRNFSPERLEDLATTLDGIDRAAAFGIFDPERGTERMVVMAEVHPRWLRNEERRMQLHKQLFQELLAADYPIDELRFVERGNLPRTTSGKLRRQECRSLFLEAEA
ncbi:MAG: hypothetical protein DWQ01_01965 [Planctomycetota bacterium]|nr:MAG: hypothetical protein DWQ01_01965 [Planctomycetota bacterium]